MEHGNRQGFTRSFMASCNELQVHRKAGKRILPEMEALSGHDLDGVNPKASGKCNEIL